MKPDHYKKKIQETNKEIRRQRSVGRWIQAVALADGSQDVNCSSLGRTKHEKIQI